MTAAYVIFASFRVPINDQMSTEHIRNERDIWVKAIDKQCVDWKRRSHFEHLYEDFKSPKELSVLENNKEVHSTCESQPETDETQNNLVPPSVTPLPLPRIKSKPPLAVPVPIPVRALPLKPECKPAKEPEQNFDTRTSPKPEKTTESMSASLPQLEPVQSPVHPPPLPPPLPAKKRAKSQILKTKAFHWDLVAQDKVLYLYSMFWRLTWNMKKTL